MTDSPIQLYKAIQVRTAKDALQSNLPSLAAIKRDLVVSNPERGELIVKAFITGIITDLVMSFNVGKTMNPVQVAELVEFIQSDYYFLKPSELKYCFDNAKKGRYTEKGKPVLYDAIDSSVILIWIEKYLEERLNIVISNNEKIHEDFKHAPQMDSEILLKVLKEVDSAQQEKEKVKERAVAPKVNYNQADPLIQGYFSDFDIAYEKKPIGSKGSKRFVDYKGKILDSTEYVEFRLKENNENV